MADGNPASDIHTSPKNIWTTKQREVLCVLLKFYSTPISESVQVFNALFEKELRKCGFTRGIPHLSLTAQWQCLYVGGAAVFERVHIETLLSDETGRWKDLREEIEETAANIGLLLVKRKFEHFRDVSKFGSKPHIYKSLSSNAQYYQDEIDEETPDLSDSISQPVGQSNAPILPTPSAVRHVQQRRQHCAENRFNPCLSTPRQRPPPTTSNTDTPTSSGSQESSQIETPALLYRYWGEQSHGYNSMRRFAAGLFCDNADSIPPITSYSQEDIDGMTLSHLCRMETPSPYISASGTLFSPLHRALHHEITAAVTVIDVSKLHSRTLFSAQEIIRERRSEFAAKYISCGHKQWTYRGKNEWLIWGEIPEDSIVCHFSMDTVLRIAKDFPEVESTLRLSALQNVSSAGGSKKSLRSFSVKIDEATGSAIGRFLRLIKLPKEYVENASTNILKAWGFEGVRWDGRGLDEERHGNYLRGVRNVYDVLIETEPAPKEEDVEVEYISIDSSDDSDQEEMQSSPITTPDSSPLNRLSGERMESSALRVTVPAGQNDRPRSALAGLKREMEEEDIGKEASMRPIEWVPVDMGQASEREAPDVKPKSGTSRMDEDEMEDAPMSSFKWVAIDMPLRERIDAKPRIENLPVMNGRDYIEIQDSDDELPAPEEVDLDRFATERNRINRLLKL